MPHILDPDYKPRVSKLSIMQWRELFGNAHFGCLTKSPIVYYYHAARFGEPTWAIGWEPKEVWNLRTRGGTLGSWWCALSSDFRITRAEYCKGLGIPYNPNALNGPEAAEASKAMYRPLVNGNGKPKKNGKPPLGRKLNLPAPQAVAYAIIRTLAPSERAPAFEAAGLGPYGPKNVFVKALESRGLKC